MKKERIATYNAFRGIAAVMILFSHMAYLAEATNPFWKHLWSYFMNHGSLATTFFFLCSGFFLSYTWKERRFGSFIVAKLKRLYPLTFIVFILALIIDIMLAGNEIVSEGVRTGSLHWFFNIVANLFLFKAFIPLESTFYSFHGPSWYISALLAFYIVGYWFVRGLHSNKPSVRRKWKRYTWTAIIAAYAIELIICVLARVNHWRTLYLCYINPYFRIFGEGLAGVMLCEQMPRIQKRINERHINGLELLAVLVFIGDFLLHNLLRLNIWNAWLQLVPMGLVFIAFRRGKGSVSGLLKTKPFQGLGDISFELYMTHAFVYEGLPIALGIVSKSVSEWIVLHAGTRFVITFVLCIIAAWIANRIMRQVNRLLFNRKSPA